MKKHVIDDDIQLQRGQLNPLVDMHLASTIHSRTSAHPDGDATKPPTAVELASSFVAPPSPAAANSPAPASIIAIQPIDSDAPSPPLGANPSPNPDANANAKPGPDIARNSVSRPSLSSQPPERRARLMSAGHTDLPAPAASSPPPRRQRFTGSTPRASKEDSPTL